MKSFIQITFMIQCAMISMLNAQELHFETTLAYPENNPRIHVKVIVGEGDQADLNYFKNVTLEALRIVEDIFKIPFRDDFSVVFDPRSDFHNGLATVLPTNRIYIHTEVPSLESSIGLVKQAHLETTAHEMAHMMMLQQRRGVFVPLSWVFGNLSRPNILFPRWVHEGMAVWTESHIGGRGQSGVIQAEMRKYAEYYQRNKKHPLRSDLMDGSLELNAMQPGNMPYHFGYLLIDDLLKDPNSKSAGELVKMSSVLPGWFFHRLFKKNGKIMTDRFNALREEWAKTAIAATPAGPPIFEARSISGPFVSDHGISWQSSSDKRQLYSNPRIQLTFQDENGGQTKTDFARGGSRIMQSYWSHELQAWVLLGYSIDLNTNHYLRKSFYVVDKTGQLLCENKEVDRVREMTLSRKNIAWIRSDEQGFFYFEKAQFSRDCKMTQIEKLTSGKVAYERLSHPWLKGDDWLVARSHGSDLSRDFIDGNNVHFEAPEGALAYPQLISVGKKPSKLLVTWYKKDFRGPALVDLATKQIKTFAQKTEAPSSYAVGEKIFSKSELWEKDQVQLLNWNESQSENSQANSAGEAPVVDRGKKQTTKELPLPDLNKKLEGQNANSEVDTYNAFPSIFPHFWYPDVESDDQGSIVSASTFFADLSGNWLGTAKIGYDSGAKRPLAYFSLLRNHLSSGMLDQMQIQALTDARFVGLQVQDIQIAQLKFRLLQRLNSRFNFAVIPGAEFRHGSGTRSLKQYSVGAPALSLLFSSPHAKNIKEGAYQITRLFDAFYFNTNARWLPEPSYEIYSNYQGIAGPVGYILGLEYGNTPVATFPKLYYEWGGRADFSTLDSGYLARGFPSTIGPALEILRAHGEFGFGVWSPQRGLAWNRMHLSDIEVRPLYEVVTMDLYQPTTSGVPRKTSVSLGKEYFQTAGVEVDVFFQALHYADFKASFGYFHGFGRLGEDNFGLKLMTLTDFL